MMLLTLSASAFASESDFPIESEIPAPEQTSADSIADNTQSDSLSLAALPAVATNPAADKNGWVSPYALPYSRHRLGEANWHRMWINTAVLSGAFVGTLFVLEMLPEDATAWNRATLQQTPMFKRWWRNIFVHNPEIDHDKFIFNYVLHPYAGAAYYMSARSCGFSFWGSFLYSFCVSTIEWEFGIEAFMERPSYQDIFITPCVGAVLGELMYCGKRHIVDNGYEVLGHQWIGRTLCFFLDPVNEVVDLFRGNPCHEIGRRNAAARRLESSLAITPRSLALTIKF